MTRSTLKLPFYAQVALVFVGLFAFAFLLYIGRSILIPLVYAGLFAILMNPVVKFLMRKRVPKVLAIAIVVVVAVAIALSLMYIAARQIAAFGESLPELEKKFQERSKEALAWISEKFNVTEEQITTWVNEKRTESMNNVAYIKTIGQVGQVLVTILLLPVYLFLILYYKPLLSEFLHRIFKPQYQERVTEVLSKTKVIIQSYLVGLFFEVLVVATLNSAGLLILGVDYAILIGVIGSLLNLIPYLGNIMAVTIPVLLSLVTEDSLTTPLLVVLLYGTVQFIDNNFLIPRIVASRVEVNALVSIIVVLIGGALWGVPGMFISIPVTAIVKVIFDNIESMQPLGFLLGNTVPSDTYSYFARRRRRKEAQKAKAAANKEGGSSENSQASSSHKETGISKFLGGKEDDKDASAKSAAGKETPKTAERKGGASGSKNQSVAKHRMSTSKVGAEEAEGDVK